MNTCPSCGAENTAVEIEVVLDRSGSMGVLCKDAIGGYNTWLAGQQAAPGAANLTLTLFDHEHITAPARPLKDAVPLTDQTYVPRGSTALYDAVSRALSRLEAKNPEKAILVILTDGQENASVETNKAQLMKRVDAAQARGWQVVYLSASPTAFTDGVGLGIRGANIGAFSHTSAGVQTAYTTATTANLAYRAGTGTTLEETTRKE